jgi:hypothetical protein
MTTAIAPAPWPEPRRGVVLARPCLGVDVVPASVALGLSKRVRVCGNVTTDPSRRCWAHRRRPGR